MNTAGLRAYQVPHAARLLASLRIHRAALDGSDTRTGKCYAALAVARELGVTPFIVCPKVAKPGWLKASKDLGVPVHLANFEAARGVSKKINWHNPAVFGPSFRQHAESELGYERHFGAKASQWVWSQAFEFAIFDEAHRCGGSKSLNSKMLIAARRQFGKVLILSATIGEDPTQFKATGYALGLFDLKDFHWWLMKRGCSPGVFGGVSFGSDPWEREEALLKINSEIYNCAPVPRGSRIRKTDIPGFPKTQIDVTLLPAEGKVEKLDSDLRKAYALKAASAKDASHHLTKITKIRQSLELLKIPDLVSLAQHYYEGSGARVAIFVNYTETIDRLVEALSKAFKSPIPFIDGRDVSGKRRDIIRAEFQANEHPVLVLNSAAGGEGISLHDEAGVIERVQLIVADYNAKTLKQVLGRPHALGAAFSLQLILAYEGTLEQEVVEDAVGKLRDLSTVNEGNASTL